MPKSYTTQQGDKWDLIAWQQMGETRLMSQLMAANTEHLGYYIFPAGIELTIPDIDTEQAAFSSLPPWRQGV